MKRMVLAPAILAVVVFCSPLAGMSQQAVAEEKTVELRAGDTMGELLGRLVGSSVELTLRNGTALSGKLSAVHQHLVLLANLRGKEFYDAVIRIEDVSAVSLRMRDR